MRIDNWPWDRIMRLPDWCFGRRWWVGEYMGSTNGTVYYRLGDEQLPDKFVVWAVVINCRAPNYDRALRLTIRLSTVIPSVTVDVRTMDRILKGISSPNIVYEFFANPNGMTRIECERQIIESNGRRLALVSNGDQVNDYRANAAIEISSVPREVPDWMGGKKAMIS